MAEMAKTLGVDARNSTAYWTKRCPEDADKTGLAPSEPRPSPQTTPNREVPVPVSARFRTGSNNDGRMQTMSDPAIEIVGMVKSYGKKPC